MKRIAAAVLATVTVLGAAMLPAQAQVDVDVAIDNPGGSRTLYVEDLSGQSLTDLDFNNLRSMPFRVRVVDATMDRSDFTVSASMTNLYLDEGDPELRWTDPINSEEVSVSALTDPLNVLDAEVTVEPVYDLVATIADGAICTILSLPVVGGTCEIVVNDVQGALQDVPMTVDMSDLTTLPLVPQGVNAGAFTNPAYEGLAAGAPQPPSPPTATSRRVIGGTTNIAAEVLGAIDTALATVISGLGADDVIDPAELQSQLRGAVDGLAWDLLAPAQVTTIVNSTVATVQALVAGQVLSQSGTYLSFPQLTVNVPTTADPGTYRGTLVVTGLE